MNLRVSRLSRWLTLAQTIASGGSPSNSCSWASVSIVSEVRRCAAMGSSIAHDLARASRSPGPSCGHTLPLQQEYERKSKNDHAPGANWAALTAAGRPGTPAGRRVLSFDLPLEPKPREPADAQA